MKKIARLSFIFLLGFLLVKPTNVFSQTLKEFFASQDVPATYLGIDFTLAKILGDATANVTDIRDRQYAGINDLVINEPKKYKVADAFRRSKLDNDITAVGKRNLAIDKDKIISTDASDYSRLKEADISKLVSGFDFGGKKGIGILLVVEAMSKTEKAAAVWPTLIDMQSKKVLLTERITGKAAGLSWRNYWAGAIHNVIDDVDDKKYKEWKAKYGG